MPLSPQKENQSGLSRDIGLVEATALNMIDMIGVGPFVTIPLIVGTMGGPQAMLGWILGAFFAVCDGLIWAELGASMPQAGGSYQYLKESYGARTLGRLMSFLFVWQLSFSAPLSIASGCLGLSQYATYLWPALNHTYFDHTFSWLVPGMGTCQIRLPITAATFVAMGCCALAVLLLYRRISVIGKLSKFLWVGVIATVLWVIVAGVTHFSAERAFSFPAGAFAPSYAFFTGLGSAMLLAFYDYWGYYNVCFLGAEIRQPERNIPRAVIYSILFVAALYLVMNISILGVVPWQEIQHYAASNGLYIASTVMQKTFGVWAGKVVAVLVIWTAFASVFSLLLGYSRVPYAAAADGNYFRSFASVHPERRFPHVSLLWLGVVAILFCVFRLADVISALVVIRISSQFLFQIFGLLWLRLRRPEFPRPFRMWLYPVPALLAAVGYLYVLRMRRGEWMSEVRVAIAIVVLGLVIFTIRAARRKEWPFSSSTLTKSLELESK
jgi:basic amino acid/polyamine antiporter, APA family